MNREDTVRVGDVLPTIIGPGQLQGKIAEFDVRVLELDRTIATSKEALESCYDIKGHEDWSRSWQVWKADLDWFDKYVSVTGPYNEIQQTWEPEWQRRRNLVKKCLGNNPPVPIPGDIPDPPKGKEPISETLEVVTLALYVGAGYMLYRVLKG